MPCPFCKEPIDDASVARCPSCAVAYLADCWACTGACGACGVAENEEAPAEGAPDPVARPLPGVEGYRQAGGHVLLESPRGRLSIPTVDAERRGQVLELLNERAVARFD